MQVPTRRNRLLALILTLALLAGCGPGAAPSGAGSTPPPPASTEPATTPPTPAPSNPPATATATQPAPTPQPSPATATATQPDPPAPRVARMELFRANPGVPMVLEGVTSLQVQPGQEVLVGTEYVLVKWFFQVRSHDKHSARLRSSGPMPEHLDDQPGLLQVRFGAGQPGRWEVWLEGVPNSRITIVRTADPAMEIYYYVPGNPMIPASGPDLPVPDTKLTLEFRFDQPINPDSAQRVLDASFLHIPSSARPAVRSEWVSPTVLQWELSFVPPTLNLATWYFQGESGLLARPVILTLRNQAKLPYLERFNPASGARERLATLPPEIIEAALAPGGRRLALRTFEKRPDRQNGWWPSGTHVVDLASGTTAKLPIDAHELAWQNENTLLNLGLGYWGEKAGWQSWNAVTGGEPLPHPERIRFATISPDGRYAAHLDRRETGGTVEDSLPISLVITDLTTGKERVIERFATTFIWGKDGDFTQWAAWSPDGGQVAGLKSDSRTGKTSLVIYDLGSLTTRVAREGLEISAFGTRLYWSPDGKRILATGSGKTPAVIPLDGGPVQELPKWGRNRAYWDSTGTRILGATGEWSGVYIYSAQSQTRTEIGDGMPVGWDGDSVLVIRWPGSAYRHQPPQL